MANVPQLEPWCNSWVVVSKETGTAVLETYQHKLVEAVNADKYDVLSSYQYLVNLNNRSMITCQR